MQTTTPTQEQLDQAVGTLIEAGFDISDGDGETVYLTNKDGVTIAVDMDQVRS